MPILYPLTITLLTFFEFGLKNFLKKLKKNLASSSSSQRKRTKDNPVKKVPSIGSQRKWQKYKAVRKKQPIN